MTATGRPLFVSFHTGGSYYGPAAAALERRCAALGLPLLMLQRPDSGAYWRNTLMKPGIILETMKARQCDLIWIDADTDLHGDHPAFQRLDADIMAASHSGDLTGIKASPLGLAFNSRSLAFVGAWAALCQMRIDGETIDLDHDILKYEVLPAFGGRISLRLMQDAAGLRSFSEGKVLTNGLSRKPVSTLQAVTARNSKRSMRFDSLCLSDFAAQPH
ncbi:hypothetical protein [Mangrovicella endophytica]|uniref:hypothetical protein n=1 Tax=Mangrovicella endophytica TaxID=2066697 RepID=UPI000C9EACED|nr:hypothetical protein [Mangrovicella endophytica]